jgi:hypothetical protein
VVKDLKENIISLRTARIVSSEDIYEYFIPVLLTIF